MVKCSGATWCVLLPIAGGETCQWHRELPALSSYEDKDAYLTRRTQVQKKAADAAKRAAKSDGRIAQRGRR